MKPSPSILLQPNVPKPLHGLNPRTILGQQWWDIQRQAAYEATDFCCTACGVHKNQAKFHRWLEAHEAYDYDWVNARATLKAINALCHLCHNFIHSGRLEMLYHEGKIPYTVFSEILWHGTQILIANNLKMNPFAQAVMARNGIAVQRVLTLDAEPIRSSGRAWADWRLVIDGTEYKPLFYSEEEWMEHYA